MKRRDVVRKIAKEAKRQGVGFTEAGGTRHNIYLLGEHKIPIPRHTEIGEGLICGVVLSRGQGEAPSGLAARAAPVSVLAGVSGWVRVSLSTRGPD